MHPLSPIRGRLLGGAILTFFGSAWLAGAFAFWPHHSKWSLTLGILLTASLLALCFTRFVQARKLPATREPDAAAQGKRVGLLFGVIFGIEGGSIGLSSVLLVSHGRASWIPITTGVIVGVHFLPLARVLKVPTYYWTGVLCIVGVLACIAIGNGPLRPLCVCLLMVAVLWGTVATILLQHEAIRSDRSLVTNGRL